MPLPQEDVWLPPLPLTESLRLSTSARICRCSGCCATPSTRPVRNLGVVRVCAGRVPCTSMERRRVLVRRRSPPRRPHKPPHSTPSPPLPPLPSPTPGLPTTAPPH